MAAREGVGAALAPAPHLLKCPVLMPPTERFRERDSHVINRKRVTSVEVNSNQTSFKETALSRSPARDGWAFRRGICKQSVLGLYGQAARLISIS